MSVRNDILTNLETALKAIEDDSSYELNIHDVSLYDENILVQQAHKVPLVMIVDTGKERLLVRDDTHYRYEWEIVLRGFVKADTESEVHEKLNKMISTLKQFVDSDSSLGSNVLDFQFIEMQTNRFDPDRMMADTIIVCHIIYWCIDGTF